MEANARKHDSVDRCSGRSRRGENTAAGAVGGGTWPKSGVRRGGNNKDWGLSETHEQRGCKET